MNQPTESARHRALLLDLAADPGDKNALLSYVNLMGIVSLGYRLSIEPNDPLAAGSTRYHGHLESPSGARFVQGDAPTVALLARELVHRWMGGSKPLRTDGADTPTAFQAIQSERRTAAVAFALAVTTAPTRACPKCKSHRTTPALGNTLVSLTAGTWECEDCHCVFQPARGRDGNLLEHLEKRCGECGAQLGRVSGIADRHFCIKCDADELEALRGEQ
jgi:hypothetical protein